MLIIPIGLLTAQVPNPTQQRPVAPVDTGQPMPIFRVTVVSRTIKAINYHHRTGTTRIDFRGTELMPAAKGQARVESRMGSTKIETEVERLEPANRFGPEFLTYVMWAITPEGRAQNIGELALEGHRAKLLSTTELQAFGLMVTAEPYFAVTQPSDVVVMENFLNSETTGTIEQVDAKYELLPRGAYTRNLPNFPAVKIDPKGPLQLAEARNAVDIARFAGADTYAADTFQKALVNLQNAEDFLRRGGDRKRSETNAREATQTAEDARIITIRKLQEEQLAQERAAAAEREASARAQADAETQRRAQAEADRAQAQAERLSAERAKREAEEATRRAETQKAEAEAASATALAQQQTARLEADRARLAADEANRGRQQAEAEKVELRERLLRQLNLILETRDTARGLIVSMADVLFDTAKYTLRPGAREKLAKVAGILLSHPGLNLEIEGHTDSVGGDDYNQRLSEQRAMAVRNYLGEQGLPETSVTAKGFGKNMPVASNDTAAGRQRNRRVELVVSGEIIGTQIGPPR